LATAGTAEVSGVLLRKITAAAFWRIVAANQEIAKLPSQWITCFNCYFGADCSFTTTTNWSRCQARMDAFALNMQLWRAGCRSDLVGICFCGIVRAGLSGYVNVSTTPSEKK
jgi:hypothetical protein